MLRIYYARGQRICYASLVWVMKRTMRCDGKGVLHRLCCKFTGLETNIGQMGDVIEYILDDCRLMGDAVPVHIKTARKEVHDLIREWCKDWDRLMMTVLAFKSIASLLCENSSIKLRVFMSPSSQMA